MAKKYFKSEQEIVEKIDAFVKHASVSLACGFCQIGNYLVSNVVIKVSLYKKYLFTIINLSNFSVHRFRDGQIRAGAPRFTLFVGEYSVRGEIKYAICGTLLLSATAT